VSRTRQLDDALRRGLGYFTTESPIYRLLLMLSGSPSHKSPNETYETPTSRRAAGILHLRRGTSIQEVLRLPRDGGRDGRPRRAISMTRIHSEGNYQQNRDKTRRDVAARGATEPTERSRSSARLNPGEKKVISERDLREHMAEMEARNSNGTRRATHT
jgi:hypothetical protein